MHRDAPEVTALKRMRQRRTGHQVQVRVFVGGKPVESLTVEERKALADHILQVTMPVYIKAAEQAVRAVSAGA